MNRHDYLEVADVQSFLSWVSPLIGGERPFDHSWASRRYGEFACSTVFEAYQRYRWPFRVTVPGGRVTCKGETFDNSLAVLDLLSGLLRSAARERDPEAFRAAALAVLQWGGVTPKNADWLVSQSDAGLLRVIDAARLLDPATADTAQLDDIPRMNAGFTKIYSLLLDGFPIYDSRVAATLGLLIRSFCVETGLSRVPSPLAIAIPPGRSGGRDKPDKGGIRLSRIGGDNARRNRLYVDSNIRAAWLLGAMANYGPFGKLDEHRRLRALEAAFFMIGYSVPEILSAG